MTNKPFISDIKKIRDRARQHMEQGAVTEGYKGDREQVIKLLNEALATEIVCVLRYKSHYFMASGIHSEPVAQEFLEHANEEQAHADALSKRIVQLGGVPNWSPTGLETRSHSEFIQGADLVQMIKENLIAERIAIDTYREMIDFIGSDDSTSRRILEEILEQEEEHAEELASLLVDIGNARN
jgi:bacterioferritin